MPSHPATAQHHTPAAQHAPAPKATPLSQQTTEQIAADLLKTRSGVRTILAYGSGIDDRKEHTDKLADVLESALHKTVDNGWFVDLPDVLLNLQHRTLPVEASVGTLTDITNNARANIKAADGHYYIDCTTTGKACNTAPITRDELNRALGTAPRTPAMNPNRSVRISNPTAAIAGYLSASLNPAQYAWGNPDGSKMSVTATVEGMLSEVSEEQTHKSFRACLTSGSDDAMQSCARVGAREGMIERVKKAASR